MATDVSEGDSEIPFLMVAPADADTSAALTVHPPDGGSAFAVTASGGDLLPIDGSDDWQQRWDTDEPVTYTLPGRWVLHWEVTGTGEGVEDFEVYVVPSPVAGGPTWLPGRSRVANYVPHRTLAQNVVSTTASDDVYLFTFDSATVPCGVQVDRLIADGVDWVTGMLTPLNIRSQPTAALLAALWAAVAIERSWPNDDQSLQRANDMEKQLNALLAGLRVSNAAANITAGTDSSPPAVLPRWSFNAPDLRWDDPRYW